MPRPEYERNGLKLPQSLQQQLGLDLSKSKDDALHPRRNRPQGRKERRRAERQERKDLRQPGRINGDQRNQNYHPEHHRKPQLTNRKQPAAPLHNKRPDQLYAPQPKKSILKVTKPPSSDKDFDSNEGLDGNSDSERSSSPGLVLDRNSKTFKDRVAQEDAEIAALEKKLGVKGRRVPEVFDDGLDDLLNGLDDYLDEDSPKKRKREADDWLSEKRRKASRGSVSYSGKDDEDSDPEEESDDGVSDDYGDALDGETSQDDTSASGENELGTDGDDFEGFDSEDAKEVIQRLPPKRENPYVAPVASGSVSEAPKYVPPSLRKSSSSTDEATVRLRRQTQGLINKLSEANILSIVTEVDRVYQSNPRQAVTSTLIDLLLSPFCDKSPLQNTFVILNAAFIAAVYKLTGTDFGAQVIGELVERLENFYLPRKDESNKQAVNLVSLLSYLYIFQVIGSVLVFDYIRLFLSELSESNTELLLKIVRDSGPQLRQDDPSSLKDIVIIMQKSLAKAGSNDQPISVRTKFMVETITDLKNNKLKSGAAGTTIAIEHITRMRRALGSLNNSRTIRGTEPLRIGLMDIKNSDKRGKWWLVGASWKEKDIDENTKDPEMANRDEPMPDEGEPDLIELARQHRMNTSVRRSIFIAIMSSSDFRDAQLRLVKLRLKKSQEMEIPRVLLHCSGSEDIYNPFYTLIAKQLCSDNKKMRTAFQYALWGFFKRLGEKPEDEAEELEDSEAVELKEIVNLAKMYGQLIADGTLNVTILRVLNLVYLKEQAKVFVEVLLISIISRCSSKTSSGLDERALMLTFGRAREVESFAKGLAYFVERVLRRTDLTSSKKESRLVKTASGLIISVLTSGQQEWGDNYEDDELAG